jgi:2,3-bisphosphoglycerate-independent phosphoglycerate mutase
MKLILLFIDGVGLGADAAKNPFYAFRTPGLDFILDGRRFTASTTGYCGSKATLLGLDASLGVPGLPQSATGQASIFTGVNASAYLGKHLNGLPNFKLRGLLALRGLFRRFQQNGYRVCFANAYRPQFFKLLAQGLPGEHYSCSTLVTYYGGLDFFSLADLQNGSAVYMDITNGLLVNQGYDLTEITPEEGALRLSALSNNYDCCLFEYFLSDLAGHQGDSEQTRKVVDTLDSFIGTLARQIDPNQTFLMVCSDHGNLEDSSVNDHTLNQVPLLMIGDPKLCHLIKTTTDNLTQLLAAADKVLAWRG